MQNFNNWLSLRESDIDQTVMRHHQGGDVKDAVKKAASFGVQQAVGMIPGADVVMGIFEKAKEWYTARQVNKPAYAALQQLKAYQETHPEYKGVVEFDDSLSALLSPGAKTQVLERLVVMLNALGNQAPYPGIANEAAIEVLGPIIENLKADTSSIKSGSNYNAHNADDTFRGRVPSSMMKKLRQNS